MGPDNDGELRDKKCPRRAFGKRPPAPKKPKGKLWRNDFIVLVKQ
jgi:hypothetical protein